MKLIPINNNTQTKLFTTNNAKITKKELKRSNNDDPQNIISSGMYSIIFHHRRNIFTAIIFIFLILASFLSLILYFALNLKPGWFAYIVPIFFFILIGYKWILLLSQYNLFNKLVSRYREDVQYDLTSVPQFLDTIYVGLIKKQIIHNWITFISIFYIGIFTLIIWWLKDQSWGFLRFHSWINSAFKNPSLITTLLLVSISILAIVYLYCSIKRKQQIYKIDSFIGNKIVSATEIVQMKALINKTWRRGFILSVLMILVIPLILRLVLKLIKR